MIRFFRCFLLLSLWVCASGAHAQVERSTTESLMRKSGLWEQLGSIAPQAEQGLQSSLELAGSAPSAAELARIADVIRASYSPARLRAISMDLISSKLDARHVPQLMGWFDSATGITVTRLEEKASAEKVDPQAQMQQGASMLKSMAADRRKLLGDLVRETHTPELWVQIMINTSVAALRGAAGVSAQAPAISERELKAALEAQRPQLEQGFSVMALTLFARTYAPLSTAQLRSYVTFLKSDAGREYNALGMEALDAALTEAAADIGRRMPSTRDQANI